jgi:hypothetical protein
VSRTSPLAAIVRELDRAEIPHMLAGSFASSYHGDPRTTNDIDLVIDPTRESLEAFVRSLDPAAYYVSEEAALDAFRRQGQFNVVVLESGWKVDLILRKERAFSHAEFERREAAAIDETQVFVATAEDTIVAKLEWARAGESERQLRDVAGILELRSSDLDVAHIERWVEELGLRAEWTRAKALLG